MIVVIPIGWIVFGYLGGRVVARKGYEPRTGVILGCCGVLGLIIALALPMTDAGREMETMENEFANGPKRANCPNCGKQIEYGSTNCPHCQYVIKLGKR